MADISLCFQKSFSPELSTFSSYDIMSHKRERGGHKNVENLIVENVESSGWPLTCYKLDNVLPCCCLSLSHDWLV